MEQTKLIEYLKSEGYHHIKELSTGQLAAIQKFVFTCGLIVGLDIAGYSGRYCYENERDAKLALEVWDGTGDPSGPWIKFKGLGVERLGPGAITDAELTTIYNEASGLDPNRHNPISTERIFAAMRKCLNMRAVDKDDVK